MRFHTELISIRWLSHLKMLGVSLLWVTICLGQAGCNALGWAASAAGPPANPPEYTPAKRPMLVLVADQPDPSGTMIESDELTLLIEQQIAAHRITPVVRSDLLSMQQGHADSPLQAAKATGAQQVLYINILSSSIEMEGTGELYQGQITALVSILEAPTGQRLWPTDGSEGRTVSFATPMLRRSDEVTPRKIRHSLYVGLADRIAKLFYAHKPDE